MRSFPATVCGFCIRLLCVFTIGINTADQIEARTKDKVDETGQYAPLPLLAPLFSDYMVLQRGKPNTVWGWTQPGKQVWVRIDGKGVAALAGADGRWQAQLDPPSLGGEHVISVDGPEHLEIHHVLVGDVWLCGGQSNMEFGLPGAKDGLREVNAANYPDIRLFTVASHVSYSPSALVKGAWRKCSPQSVAESGGFSAVAYYFGRKVHAETGVPIGLIQDCLGGTPIETWMDPRTLKARGDFDLPLAELDRLQAAGAPAYGSYLMHWLDEFDIGLKPTSWADPALDDGKWTQVELLHGFERLGLQHAPAVVWFRTEVILPEVRPTGDAHLELGVIEKMDTAYVNGHWVGASSWVENPRVYEVPASLLHPGRNVIAVRVFKVTSTTGFLSEPDRIRMTVPGVGNFRLDGRWKARLSVDASPPHPMPIGFENYPTMPSVLYLGMIRPLAPVALAGVLWYQGEANTGRAYQYRSLLPEMIADWRNVFNQGDLPFFIVGLPAFQEHRDQPGTDGWTELREAQALTAQSVPNTALTVTVDTGEAQNIHPKDKRPVGERLALSALARYYKKNVVSSGPTFVSLARFGRELRVHFDHTDGGLIVRGGRLGEFSVAGNDRQWHWAQARINGDDIILAAPEVAAPVAARYAWQANPVATLFNGAGLPAAPFRSDDWPEPSE